MPLAYWIVSRTRRTMKGFIMRKVSTKGRIAFIFLVMGFSLSLSAQDRGQHDGSSSTQLLPDFRSIGGAANNLTHPDFDPTPGRPELALAPLNFASGTKNGL